MSSEAGITRGFKEAASSGSTVVKDNASGLEVDLAKVMAAPKDPRLPAKEALAREMADFLGSGGGRVLDVGCGVGSDVGLYLSKIPGGTIYGLDLLESLLETARDAFPDAHFVQGDAHALPFEDDYFDIVHCERLLFHAENIHRCIDEMIRVLRPGGMAILVEGDMRNAGVLHCENHNHKKIYSMKMDSMAKAVACPFAAADIYRSFLQNEGVEHVSIQGIPFLMTDFETFDPGLHMERQYLNKLVEGGELAMEEVDPYIDALLHARMTGMFSSGLVFKVSCVKKC